MARRRTHNVTPAAASFPDVRVVGGLAFELIAELAAFTSGPARASLDSGNAWIREVRKLAAAELIDRVERNHLGVYAELVTVALEASDPRGVDEFLVELERLDADVLQRRLLGADSPLNRTMVTDNAFERAIAGDSRAKGEVRSSLGTDQRHRQAIDPRAQRATGRHQRRGDGHHARLGRARVATLRRRLHGSDRTRCRGHGSHVAHQSGEGGIGGCDERRHVRAIALDRRRGDRPYGRIAPLRRPDRLPAYRSVRVFGGRRVARGRRRRPDTPPCEDRGSPSATSCAYVSCVCSRTRT
jgi:hypothetical protein